ncbi:hypothetical protein B484DRAFT_463345, partial [Ochromonadaceae sp. CCMP2298]
MLTLLLKCHPGQALRSLVYMASYLGAAALPTFEVLPQRKSLIPCAIRIDTALLIQLLDMPSATRTALAKSGLRSDASRKLWERVLTPRAYRTGRTGTEFAHSVRTDGYGLHISRATSTGLEKRGAKSDKGAT